VQSSRQLSAFSSQLETELRLKAVFSPAELGWESKLQMLTLRADEIVLQIQSIQL
jgi:hypothetical protein